MLKGVVKTAQQGGLRLVKWVVRLHGSHRPGVLREKLLEN